MPAPHTDQRDDVRTGAGALLAAACIAVIAWSTLRAQPGEFGGTAVANWSPFEALLNVLLFLPLGVGLALLGFRFRGVLATGVVLSAGIELAQRWLVQGRFASLADVVANGLGVALGAWVVLRWDRRDRWWRWVAPFVVVTIVLAWVLGGYLVQPAVPPATEWQVEAGPLQVLDAALQGVPLVPGEVADVARLRGLLSASRKTRLTLDFVTAAPRDQPTPLFRVVTGTGRSGFLGLMQDGTTLRGYQRTGLRWVGLRGPWLVLRDAVPARPGDTVHVVLEATRRHLLLSTTTSDGVERHTAIRLSPDLYATALFARVTDGVLWWWIVPGALCFVALGLALATHSRLLALTCLVLLVLIPNRADCAYPNLLGAAVSVAGAVLGLRLGRRIGLFGGAKSNR